MHDTQTFARRAAVVAGALATLIMVDGAATAPKKGRDQVWTHPDIAASKIDRIALIPAATYDNNLQNENMIETVLGQDLRSSGYRWISGTTTRELLRAKTGGDSMLKVLKQDILDDARLDSVRAGYVAGMLNSTGVLIVRVDQFEQRQLEWNQSGRPSTTVQLKAALSDGSGRTVWTASGGETAEGSYYDPNAGTVSVKDTGLDRKPVTGATGAPGFRETLHVLFTRWATVFPPKPAAPAAPDGSAPAPTGERNAGVMTEAPPPPVDSIKTNQ